MTRSLTIVAAFTLLLSVGCLRDRNKAADPLRPDIARAAAPSSKRQPVQPASRTATPEDVRVAPPSFEEPAKFDDRKTGPEKREERKEKRKDAEAPKLPSPFAPKDLAKPDPPKPVETKPAEGKPANSDIAAIKKIYEIASSQWDKLVDFEARLTRREVVGKNESPLEEVLFQYRKKPMSVYMRNVGDAGRGREVLYVDGQHDGKMHVVIGEGDGSLFAKQGAKLAFPPNSPLVTSKSRHKVTEAGFGEQLAKFGKLVGLVENGTRPGGIKNLGKVERKEYPYALDGLEVTLQPGDDPTLPRGGRKFIYFDLKESSPSYGFPVLIITQDDSGRDVEYYCFDKFKNPANLTDADFSPDRLQSKKK